MQYKPGRVKYTKHWKQSAQMGYPAETKETSSNDRRDDLRRDDLRRDDLDRCPPKVQGRVGPFKRYVAHELQLVAAICGVF